MGREKEEQEASDDGSEEPVNEGFLEFGPDEEEEKKPLTGRRLKREKEMKKKMRSGTFGKYAHVAFAWAGHAAMPHAPFGSQCAAVHTTNATCPLSVPPQSPWD